MGFIVLHRDTDGSNGIVSHFNNGKTFALRILLLRRKTPSFLVERPVKYHTSVLKDELWFFLGIRNYVRPDPDKVEIRFRIFIFSILFTHWDTPNFTQIWTFYQICSTVASYLCFDETRQNTWALGLCCLLYSYRVYGSDLRQITTHGASFFLQLKKEFTQLIIRCRCLIITEFTPPSWLLFLLIWLFDPWKS